jgi:hypothetical protein
VLAILPLSARAGSTVTSSEMVIRLTVRPMAAPKPALRYLLLPELKEMNPGNPIPNYLRCLVDRGPSGRPETIGRAALRQADWAARLDKPDWQLLPKLKTEGIGLLIPDVQQLRELAAGLQERFRDEVAKGRFDDALRTAKTMFALGRHLGEHPTLIGGLVGMAIVFIAIEPLEEMLEQPGCPNLYWALTDLPSPLISLDKGMQGERVLILAEFRDLNDRAPMSAVQLRKVIAHIELLRPLATGKPKKSLRPWLDARGKDNKLLRAARRRLAESGLSEELLARFPAEQVLLLDEKREFEVRRDEVMKLMKLPPWQADALASRKAPAREPALLDFLLPALLKVRLAQGRLEQRIALLRHVEALRLYAAAHGSRLPVQLADCPVPLPDDPFTGKPFRYRREGATAHLYGSPPRALKNSPFFNLHYEVTIRKGGSR